jgi:dTDP-4-dehydrorhamnose reductase
MKPVCIVTGKNGQLGRTLQTLSGAAPDIQFLFFDRNEMDITSAEQVESVFRRYTPAYLINAAAFTQVDKAESDQVAAYKTNTEAVRHLASCCNQYQCKFIHISTDYVFDGTSEAPYMENDKTNPINYYGYTKWQGEVIAVQQHPDSMILRTSWLYSEYGHNFVRTMIRLMKERKELRIVHDQTGTPTYAADLAAALLNIVQVSEKKNGIWHPGIFHFTNKGQATWFEFACTIRHLLDFDSIIQPLLTSEYPTAAKRPSFSILDTQKFRTHFDTVIPSWQESLKLCLFNLEK